MLVPAWVLLIGCGVGPDSAKSKISETTDTYLRSLASGDSAKACEQLTEAAQKSASGSCVSQMQRIATAVGRERLAMAADTGASISVEGTTASATVKELDARLRLIQRADSRWLIESGYELGGQ